MKPKKLYLIRFFASEELLKKMHKDIRMSWFSDRRLNMITHNVTNPEEYWQRLIRKYEPSWPVAAKIYELTLSEDKTSPKGQDRNNLNASLLYASAYQDED